MRMKKQTSHVSECINDNPHEVTKTCFLFYFNSKPTIVKLLKEVKNENASKTRQL